MRAAEAFGVGAGRCPAGGIDRHELPVGVLHEGEESPPTPHMCGETTASVTAACNAASTALPPLANAAAAASAARGCGVATAHRSPRAENDPPSDAGGLIRAGSARGSRRRIPPCAGPAAAGCVDGSPPSILPSWIRFSRPSFTSDASASTHAEGSAPNVRRLRPPRSR